MKQKLSVISQKIFSGAPIYSITKLPENQEGIPVINIKDIADGEISVKDSKRYSIADFKNAVHYIVEPNDILISSRGTHLKIAVVPDSLKKALISSNLIAIRPANEINPMFLASYLKTSMGTSDLLKNSKSSTMQITLNISDVQNIDVPVPSIEIQNRLAELIRLTNKQKNILSEYTTLLKEVSNQIFLNSLEAK